MAIQRRRPTNERGRRRRWAGLAALLALAAPVAGWAHMDAARATIAPGGGTVPISTTTTTTTVPAPATTTTVPAPTTTPPPPQTTTTTAVAATPQAPPTPAPTAVDDGTYTVELGKVRTVPAEIGVLANDRSFDPAMHVVLVVGRPANSTVDLDPNTGAFVITPGPFTGADAFVYCIGAKATSTCLPVPGTTATVDFSIDAKVPKAVDDTITGATLGNPFSVTDPNLGVAGNDDNMDLAVYRVTLVDPKPYPSFTLNGDGTYTFTPDHAGTATFRYCIAEIGPGGCFDTGDVTIDIANAVDPVVNDDEFSTHMGVVLTVPTRGVLANDSSFVDGRNGLRVTAAPDPAQGTLTAPLADDGSFAFTPAAGFVGAASFTYCATDITGTRPDGACVSGEATVLIHVTGELPVQAVDDAFTTPRATALHVPAPGVLGNDIPSAGIVVVTHSTPTSGTALVNPDGSLTYTPAAGFVGTDSFTYTVGPLAVPGPRGRSRRARLAGDTAAVTVEVTDAAAGPQAVDDITTTGAGMRLDVGSPGVLSNDIGTNLTVTANTAPGHGSVTMQPNGAFSYTPAVFTGRDSFTYTITDGAGLTSIAIVAVDVTPIATPPTTIQHPDGGGHGTACCVATVATTPTITTTTLARTGGRLDLGLALGLALVALGAALIGGSRLLRRKPF